MGVECFALVSFLYFKVIMFPYLFLCAVAHFIYIYKFTSYRRQNRKIYSRIILNLGPEINQLKICSFRFECRETALARSPVGMQFSGTVLDRCQPSILRNFKSC